MDEKYEVTGKKRFDPRKAFSHSTRKENTPLSEISNGKSFLLEGEHSTLSTEVTVQVEHIVHSFFNKNLSF